MSAPRILAVDRTWSFAHQVAEVAGQLEDRPEVVVIGRPNELPKVLTCEGPFDVLLAGPGAMTRDGIVQLSDLRRREPPMAILLAVSGWFPGSRRDLVRTGAVDLLELPVDDEELLSSLNDALDVAAAARRLMATAPAPSEASAPKKVHTAKVYTVASATGGCGKTFYATNLATFLARQTGERVCLLDLDLQFGEVSTALRLKPRYTIYDALSRNEGDVDDLSAHLDEYLVTHESGVRVLAAPRSPAEADQISPPQVTEVIEQLRTQFDHLVVDTPAQLSEVVLAAFDQSEVLLVMVALDLPSVRNMTVFLGTLDRLRIPTQHVRVILNKAESGVGIEVGQVEKLVPQGLMSILPYAKEVSRSINMGTPVVEASPDAEVSRQLILGMSQLLPEGQRPLVPEPVRHGLRRLFARTGRVRAATT